MPLAALLSSRSSISTSRTRSNKGAQRFYTSGRIDALPTRRGVDATLMGRSLSPQPAWPCWVSIRDGRPKTPWCLMSTGALLSPWNRLEA